MRRFSFALIMLLPLWLAAANFFDLPTQVVQPDGSVLNLFASGDEYANRLHDAQGYSIIQNSRDGYYYYAVLSDGEPAPSLWRADSSNPRDLGLRPGVNVSPSTYQARVQAMQDPRRDDHRAPNTGTVNNLVVYIRFSDQTEFEETRASYDAKFNAQGANQYSLRNYFQQVSYNQLDYVSHHYPVCAPETNLSYLDTHPRAYYMPYNQITNPQGYRDWQRTEREQALLANAIAAIAPQVPTSLNIDADNDSYVDNVCFIIRGPHTAWAELLWAHRWVLYNEDAFINGKQVWDFTFQPENQNTVRTLCHEMFHSVGAPDLYHYNFDGLTPAGCWDIMESGNGHMGMHMKAKYGMWIEPIPTIGLGTHTLSPVNSQYNNALRYPLSATEYLVFEYRQKGADIFEAGLPNSGLLIYRINETQSGNAQGPPDEVYVFRPNGTATVNGTVSAAAFSSASGQTAFNLHTNPSCFLTGGTPQAVNIQNISEAGETISFTLEPVSGLYPPVVQSLTPADGAILPLGLFQAEAQVSAPGSSIVSVAFYLNQQLMGIDYEAPFSVAIPPEIQTAGNYTLRAVATNAEQLTATQNADIRLVDPQIPTWFSWLGEEPVWEEFGRGAVPIKVALEMNLGAEEYLLKKIAFRVADNPWGNPQNPGVVNAKINRFAGGAITDQTLINIGDILCPLDGRFEYIVNSEVPISGHIAVILDLFEYQNIVFDTNGTGGHTWLTEPDRPWTDALARGMLGSAAIELLLQSPYVSQQDPLAPPALSALAVGPNPFSHGTSVSFDLKRVERVEAVIFNLRGQVVRKLLEAELPSGKHSLIWDGRGSDGQAVGAGIYMLTLRTGGEIRTKRLAIIK